MIIGQAQLEWVNPPQQTRSQHTLERLLDAAESLIAEKGVDNTTVAEVAKRADSSVGAFYSRFRDKEGLVRCVFERFTRQAIATTEAALAPERWHGVGVIDALETMVAFMLRVLEEKRRLITAMAIRAAEDEEVNAFGRRLQDVVTERAAQLFEQRCEVLDHPDPDVAVFVAVGLCLSCIESRTIHGPHPTKPLSDEQLCRELVRMCVRYLGLTDRTSAAEHDVPAAEHDAAQDARQSN
jgi:AcrR family transcriptional regulator